MEKDHFSKEWDDAPMPHSIFFTDRGHAIHGSRETRRLGHTASRGCVRLSTANAATLYALVEQTGMANTEIVISGSGGSLADWPELPGGASVPHVNLGPEWSALYEPTCHRPGAAGADRASSQPGRQPVAPDKASPYPRPTGDNDEQPSAAVQQLYVSLARAISGTIDVVFETRLLRRTACRLRRTDVSSGGDPRTRPLNGRQPWRSGPATVRTTMLASRESSPNTGSPPAVVSDPKRT